MINRDNDKKRGGDVSLVEDTAKILDVRMENMHNKTMKLVLLLTSTNDPKPNTKG